MTFAEQKEIEIALKANDIFRAQRDLRSFTTYTKPDYIPNWHHDYTFSRLNEIGKGKGLRLIFKYPSRHGKTEIIGRRLPAFLLGMNPDLQILYATHNATLASKVNRQVQRIMLSSKYKRIFPNTELNDKNIRAQSVQSLRNSDIFEIVGRNGQFRNAGVGVGIGGENADVILLDDYLPDMEAANSQKIRDGQWEWLAGDLLTRQAPGADVIIDATQRHEDDLIGRVIALGEQNPNADRYEVITFPLICDYEEVGLPKPSYDIRDEGEPLWHPRFDIEYIEKLRATQGAHLFSAISQQRPTAREGNVIKRSWYEPHVYVYPKEDIREHCIYWDLGGSDSPTADSTVGTVSAKLEDGRVMELWQHAGQWNATDRDREMIEFSSRWNVIYPNIPIWIEAGVGLSVDPVNVLANKLRAVGLNVLTDRVTTSKAGRADPFISASGAHRILFYAGDHFHKHGFSNGVERWINPFTNEVLRLQYKDTPNGTVFTGGHDDRLDSAANGYNKLTAGLLQVKMW